MNKAGYFVPLQIIHHYLNMLEPIHVNYLPQESIIKHGSDFTEIICRLYYLLRLFLKKFGGMSPFCGSPVLDFCWRILRVPKQECVALLALGRGTRVMHSSRFTSGITLVDLLAASIADKPNSSMYLPEGIGGAQNRDLPPRRRLIVFEGIF